MSVHEFMDKLEALTNRPTNKQINYAKELYYEVYNKNAQIPEGCTKQQLSKIINILEAKKFA